MNHLIFYPVIAQILLTVYLYVLLNIRKTRAAKEGRVDESRRGLYDDAWPGDVITVNNCIRNQFEVPILFYVVCIMLQLSQTTNIMLLSAAWLFVISRIGHAIVQTTSNHVPTRRRLFIVGVISLLLLLVNLAIAL